MGAIGLVALGDPGEPAGAARLRIGRRTRICTRSRAAPRSSCSCRSCSASSISCSSRSRGLGLQTFIPTVLGSVYGVSLALATSTLTAYLLGGAAGILTGGFLAARTTRHDRVAASGMLLAAFVLVVVAMGARTLAVAAARFRADRLRAGVDGPFARPHRSRRDAQGRGGTRLRLRLFRARPGRHHRSRRVRVHARSRASAAMLFGVAACYLRRDRHGHSRAHRIDRGARRSLARSR